MYCLCRCGMGYEFRRGECGVIDLVHRYAMISVRVRVGMCVDENQRGEECANAVLDVWMMLLSMTKKACGSVT